VVCRGGAWRGVAWRGVALRGVTLRGVGRRTPEWAAGPGGDRGRRVLRGGV